MGVSFSPWAWAGATAPLSPLLCSVGSAHRSRDQGPRATPAPAGQGGQVALLLRGPLTSSLQV